MQKTNRTLLILASSWNIIGGYTGYASFGNIVFFGLGAYAAAILMSNLGLGFFPSLLLSGRSFRDRPADQLSVASRKRLEIAKALAMSPEVILFDEVMAGLNPKEIDLAVALIQQIRDRGISIIVIEHVIRAIKAISDRLFVLQQGKKIAEGPPPRS